MNFALVGNARTNSATFVAAVGWPALGAVGVAGFSVGFFLWYALALQGPHSAAVLDPSLPLALAIGIVVSYGAWIA